MSSTNTNDNPLRQGIRLEKTAEPCVVVIFGASGDLTSRKLIPALYLLAHKGRLPKQTRIIGVARSKFTNESWRTELEEST